MFYSFLLMMLINIGIFYIKTVWKAKSKHIIKFNLFSESSAYIQSYLLFSLLYLILEVWFCKKSISYLMIPFLRQSVQKWMLQDGAIPDRLFFCIRFNLQCFCQDVLQWPSFWMLFEFPWQKLLCPHQAKHKNPHQPKQHMTQQTEQKHDTSCFWFVCSLATFLSCFKNTYLSKIMCSS